MEKEVPEKKESALDKINKIIFAVCSFVIVLLINDNRRTIEKIEQSLASISSGYSKLDTRVTVLEYVVGLQKKTANASNTNKKIPEPPFFAERILTKPEDEYRFKAGF